MFITKFIFFIFWKILLKCKYFFYNFFYKQNINLSANLKIINKLKEDGYVVIRNYINRKDCKKIIKDIDLYLNNNNFYWIDKENSDKRIFGSENISKLILDFHKSKMLKSIGSNYVGIELKNAFTMANKIRYHKANKGSGGGWHKDSFTTQYKTILYLNDVEIENGPFELVVSSQKNDIWFKICRSFNLNLFQTRFKNKQINHDFVKKNKIKTLNGKAGTLIIVDSSVIHRGRPLNKGHRYAITNYYYPHYNYKKYKKKIKPMLTSKFLNIK